LAFFSLHPPHAATCFLCCFLTLFFLTLFLFLTIVFNQTFWVIAVVSSFVSSPPLIDPLGFRFVASLEFPSLVFHPRGCPPPFVSSHLFFFFFFSSSRVRLIPTLFSVNHSSVCLFFLFFSTLPLQSGPWKRGSRSPFLFYPSFAVLIPPPPEPLRFLFKPPPPLFSPFRPSSPCPRPVFYLDFFFGLRFTTPSFFLDPSLFLFGIHLVPLSVDIWTSCFSFEPRLTGKLRKSSLSFKLRVF